MIKITIFILAVCFYVASLESPALNDTNTTSSSLTSIETYPSNSSLRSRYPVLFRDHVYYKLSEKGKKLFHAVNVHPDCVAKKGQCIQRARCIGRDMLYISRICYKRDLVCCYDNSIRFPEVAFNAYQPPTPANVTEEIFIEPEALP